MSANPVLVIQPRRMGDLILTFPLLMDLQRLYPQSPVWVAAQKHFYEPLMPFAPKALFFPIERLPWLGAQIYEAVINLGGAEAAAQCAGQAKAEQKLGPILDNGVLHINGFWQLYRESLTCNNRHNALHWADLFRMDISPLPIPVTVRPGPKSPGNRRIGLFTGASEIAKRPAANFWVSLASRLASMRFKPVLLGGPAEKELGEAIIAKGGRAANFCGKTSIAQLAGLMRAFDLLITPDTGPMHLADWLGVPVLNLSLGPVHALETGPLSPGQHVLRADMSCVGCWQCQRGRPNCHFAFTPASVANLASALACGEKEITVPKRLELLTTSRDALRLYTLAGRRQSASSMLDDFWKKAFLSFNNTDYQNMFAEAASGLATAYPALARNMAKTFANMAAAIARKARKQEPLPDDFWRKAPRHSRMFAGNIQMALQNGNYSRAAFADALERVAMLGSNFTSF